MANQLWMYGFPDSYTDVINASSVVKYVSASGNDSNNGNTPTTPYLTIGQAQTATSGTATSVTIVIMAGTYITTPGVATATADAMAGLSDNNLPRKFVCCPGQTTIQWTASGGQRDATMVDFRNAGSVLYGAKLLRNNNARTLSYATAFFNSSTAGTQQGTFYNCVFRETNANNTWSFQYDNGGTQSPKIYNTTFYVGAAPLADWTSSASLVISNSVFNVASFTSPGTRTNVGYSASINPTTYVATGITTQGVYSGTYAWNSAITPDAPGLYTSANIAYSGSPFNVTLATSGIANGTSVPYTISGVTSAEISGASLTGNFTINGNVAIATFTPSITTISTSTFSISSNTYTANVVLSAYFSITAPVVLETIYPTIVNPLPGQLDINHMGANAIFDPTLQPSTAIKTILSNSYLENKVIVPTPTTTTKTNGPLTVYIAKPMGDNPNREFWM